MSFEEWYTSDRSETAVDIDFGTSTILSLKELKRVAKAAWDASAQRAAARIAELEKAITTTLNDNGHLTDGDCCTLIELKRVMPNWELEGESGES